MWSKSLSQFDTTTPLVINPMDPADPDPYSYMAGPDENTVSHKIEFSSILMKEVTVQGGYVHGVVHIHDAKMLKKFKFLKVGGLEKPTEAWECITDASKETMVPPCMFRIR
jgi:hypothetical protein